MRLRRVLIIEDDEVQARGLSKALRDRIGGTPEGVAPFARTLREGIERLQKDPDGFSAVVLDMRFASHKDEGLRFLQFLRLVGVAAPKTPVIVLTAQDDVSLCVRAMQAGAANFIVKGAPDNVDIDASTIDRVIHACETAVDQGKNVRNHNIEEWLEAHSAELREKYPGKLIAVFPLGREVKDAELLGDRYFVAFGTDEEARLAFLKHLDWLDYDVQLAAIERSR